MKSILILDDHPIFREGLKSVIKKYFDFIIFECGHFNECLKILNTYNIDLITVDLNLPEYDGVEVIKFLRKHYKNTKILVISMYANKIIIKKIKELNVDGYLCKDDVGDKLIIALNNIFDGKQFFIGGGGEEEEEEEEKEKENNFRKLNEKTSRFFLLTPSEKDVFKLLASGKNTKEIAYILNKSFKTVANQRTKIFEKLNIKSDIELMQIALNLNLIEI